MTEPETMSASDFKAKCLNVLDRLAAHELDRVVITKRGLPVAVLVPPDRSADAVRRIHGFMKGSVIISDDVDLTLPGLDEAFTAENDELHG